MDSSSAKQMQVDWTQSLQKNFHYLSKSDILVKHMPSIFLLKKEVQNSCRMEIKSWLSCVLSCVMRLGNTSSQLENSCGLIAWS